MTTQISVGLKKIVITLNSGKRGKNSITHKLLMKIQNYTGIRENSLEVSHKTKHAITYLDTYSK